MHPMLRANDFTKKEMNINFPIRGTSGANSSKLFVINLRDTGRSSIYRYLSWRGIREPYPRLQESAADPVEAPSHAMFGT